MRLYKARVQNYRSIIDSGEFEIENLKTILVGPNEAGKSVLLNALQKLKKPEDVSNFDILRDYPRAHYNDVTMGKVLPESTTVVTGFFELESSDKDLIPEDFHNCILKLYRNYDNEGYYSLINAPEKTKYSDIEKDLIRISTHMDTQFKSINPDIDEGKPSKKLKEICENLLNNSIINEEVSKELTAWLNSNLEYIEEENEKEEARFDKIKTFIEFNKTHNDVSNLLNEKIPVFILFNNYFKVKPSIHLEHLAQRTEQNILDDEYFDYGNLCLLKLLGFTARELADIGNAKSPKRDDKQALQEYKDMLDRRLYQLNAASVKLTKEICSAWLPNKERAEADKLKLVADSQYLKVVVEDDVGVEIELDQRSEGFQWLVSFFVVFFAEAIDKHQNAILLLDEPGMSLHGLKQRDFRKTISRLAEKNQTIFTTHSPFLVGPDELDIVKVVELVDRKIGTKVHTTLSSSDPAGLLPLQEALGYDLANSLFAQQRNLILEGITDYWYLEAVSNLLREGKIIDLNDKISLVFANSAGKVVYYATILHAHNLKVAALLDSDNAGDQAAQQENLVHTLGNKKILRTKDYCSNINKPEIEDLLRLTLIELVNSFYSKDLTQLCLQHNKRPIVDIFETEIVNFSKYKLAKEFVRWSRDNDANSLKEDEISSFKTLITNINRVLK